MSRRRYNVWGLVALTLLAGATLVLGGVTHHAYWINKRWPELIQSETLGHVVTTDSKLVSREGSSAYGQGLYRWTYQLSVGDIAAICGKAIRQACQLNKHLHTKDGVDRIVAYSDGTLVLEEIWN